MDAQAVIAVLQARLRDAGLDDSLPPDLVTVVAEPQSAEERVMQEECPELTLSEIREIGLVSGDSDPTPEVQVAEPIVAPPVYVSGRLESEDSKGQSVISSCHMAALAVASSERALMEQNAVCPFCQIGNQECDCDLCHLTGCYECVTAGWGPFLCPNCATLQEEKNGQAAEEPSLEETESDSDDESDQIDWVAYLDLTEWRWAGSLDQGVLVDQEGKRVLVDAGCSDFMLRIRMEITPSHVRHNDIKDFNLLLQYEGTSYRADPIVHIQNLNPEFGDIIQLDPRRYTLVYKKVEGGICFRVQHPLNLDFGLLKRKALRFAGFDGDLSLYEGKTMEEIFEIYGQVQNEPPEPPPEPPAEEYPPEPPPEPSAEESDEN